MRVASEFSRLVGTSTVLKFEADCTTKVALVRNPFEGLGALPAQSIEEAPRSSPYRPQDAQTHHKPSNPEFRTARKSPVLPANIMLKCSLC